MIGAMEKAVIAYMSKLGRKGGTWTGPRRKEIGRIGGLASGQSRRRQAALKKSEKKS